MTNRDIAEYTLEALTKAGADGAQIIVARGSTDELNIDGGQFSLMRSLFNSALSIKAVKDGRKGTAAINRLSAEDIDAAVVSCIVSAESGVPDEAERIAPFDGKENFVTGASESDAPLLYERMKELMSDVGHNYPKIIMEQFIAKYEHKESLLMNTNGTEFSCVGGQYGFETMFSAHDGDAASSFNGYYAGDYRLGKRFIDYDMHRELIDEAERSVRTRAVDGKFVGPVIITPACLGEILNYALRCFASDGVIIDRTSLWLDKIGKDVADARLNLSSAPLDARIVGGERFTADGYKSADMEIIKDGVLRGFILSDYGAQKTGFARAKNLASNYVVRPGEKSLADMIAGIERGLIVNRFSGGSPSQNGDFSGVAKNSFMIENGRITDAVSETMISGNLAGILKNIKDISSDTASAGQSVLPWIAFEGMTVSGK